MISVCMATYNGKEYLAEQLDSILLQITPDDEIVVSDDGSTDGTVALIQRYKKIYKNIRLIAGPQNGVVENFENAIKESKGDIIFLCDQDDKWSSNKVKKVIKYFENDNCFVVVHDARIVNENGQIIEESYFNYRGSKKGFIKNIMKNSYIGCCMAFRSKMKKWILPIPNHIEMHDWWIGLLSEVDNHSEFISNKLIDYRRHGNNVSSFQHYGIIKMIWNRMYILTYLTIRIVKLKITGKWNI